MIQINLVPKMALKLFSSLTRTRTIYLAEMQAYQRIKDDLDEHLHGLRYRTPHLRTTECARRSFLTAFRKVRLPD